MRTRTHLLQVWMNDEEWNTLNRRCKKSGLPKSIYIRQLIHGLQPPDFRLFMRQFYYIGNSLNQIARKTHALNVIDAQKYDEEIAKYHDAPTRKPAAVLPRKRRPEGESKLLS